MSVGFKCGVVKVVQEGGAGLNFTISAQALEPSSPTENDIWCKTDVEVSSWAMSSSEPSSPVEGLLWITLGAGSPVAFNAISENVLMVYPLSASIYTSGAWVTVECVSYINGRWVPWATDQYLLNGNDTYDAITGGWTGTAFSDSNGAYMGRNADTYQSASVGMVGVYDFSPYSELVVNAYATRGTVAVLDESGATVLTQNVVVGVKRDYVFDVSGLTGAHKVVVSGVAGGAGAAVIIRVYSALLTI